MKSTSPTFQKLKKSLLYSVWLPISIIILNLIRFSVMHTVEIDVLVLLKHSGMLFLIAWPSAVPMTIALQKLYRRSRNTAFFMGIIFVPLAALAATVGGLLGFLGIIVYALFMSLPIWLALSIVTFIQNRRLLRQN